MRKLLLALTLAVGAAACGSDAEGADVGKPRPAEVTVIEKGDATCYVYDEDGEGGAGISCLPHAEPGTTTTTDPFDYDR